jgi:L-threonylcarbamoyladenylate synthase
MIRPDSFETRKLAAKIVSDGGLIAFRTDTFYGLGVDPLNVHAVRRIKVLKGREEGKPILLLIADAAVVTRLMAEAPTLFERVITELWPGPLTIIVPATDLMPADITAGTGTVGLRLPQCESVRVLVRECGGVLTATSANPAGEQPAKTAAEVIAYFPSGIDLIVDGGTVTGTEPSTVIDIVRAPARLIREGAVSRTEIEKVLGGLMSDML